MKSEIIKLLARHLLGIGGAYLVTKGMLSAETADMLSNNLVEVLFGGGMTTLAVGASYLDKVNRKPSETIVVREPVTITEPSIPPPKGYSFGERSLSVLAEVDERLARVFKSAIIGSPYDFTVYHGYRTDEEQEAYLASGKSWVSRSRHQDRRAVDIYLTFDGGKTAYWGETYLNGHSVEEQLHAYNAIAEHVIETGKRLGIDVEWGGHWKKRDNVHFQI